MSSKTLKHFFRNVEFVPCRYHRGTRGKDSYLFYYVKNPESGLLQRFKIMLNKYKEGAERDFMISQIGANVYNNYLHGVTPFTKMTNVRSNVKIVDILTRYRTYLIKMAAKSVMSVKTRDDYSSRIHILSEYIEDRSLNGMMAYEFSTAFCTDFLDYILLDRETSTLTRNNYRTWLSAFCSWLVEKQYITENPIAKIPVLPIKKKFREALPISDIVKLSDYLKVNDRRFLMACMMEYYCFIRPTELIKIKVSDVSLERQTIFISSAVSKNRKDGLVALNDEICQMLIELNVLESPGNFYLFGRNFEPSTKRARSDIFRLRFDVLRAELGFPKSYMFYSLKDSGIRDLSNSQGIVTAKFQARHSSVEVTNHYLVGKDGYVSEETKHFKGFL